MKIAYLLTRADPLGGAQVHVRDLAASVAAEGHSATVITSGGGPLLDQLRAQGTPTIVSRHLCMPIAPVRDARALSEIRAVLKELRPDLLTAHSAKAGILGRLAARPLNIPVVLTAHGWTFTPGIPRGPAAVYRTIERLAAPAARKIITVCEFDRRLALAAGIAGEDRIVTVYNGVYDVPLRLRADPSRSPPRLVMVARFGAQKDHTTLLHALGGLRHLLWELDLVGAGDPMRDMQALAAALNIADRVHFLGQRTDVDEILARSQVNLLITNYEGFPLSILEAMRAGVPVIASSVGGNGESVRDGETGYLVPRGGVDVLRDRIARLLRKPELRSRLGHCGREYFEQRFTLGHSVAKTLAVYREVLAAWKPSGHAASALQVDEIGS
jgi:glycosyltransferase involved in cell wall biosynthesis